MAEMMFCVSKSRCVIVMTNLAFTPEGRKRKKRIYEETVYTIQVFHLREKAVED